MPYRLPTGGISGHVLSMGRWENFKINDNELDHDVLTILLKGSYEDKTYYLFCDVTTAVMRDRDSDDRE